MQPAAPVTPVGPAPVQQPVAPMPAAANPVVQPPVNPVVNPAVSASVNPVFQPGNLNGVAATDPIMMPEPAPAPDPIEEELKAPMKAAGPVPGSIGSAVSGPEAAEPMPVNDSAFVAPAGSPQSVSFTDPAAQPEMNALRAAILIYVLQWLTMLMNQPCMIPESASADLASITATC